MRYEMGVVLHPFHGGIPLDAGLIVNERGRTSRGGFTLNSLTKHT